MKKTLLLVAALLTLGLATAQNTQKERLQKHLYYMAADSLRGRQAGSADAQKVANYLAEQYRDMGAMPLFEDYLMPFSLKEAEGVMGMAFSMMGDSKVYQNVVIVIPGNDLKLRHEFIVVGGHYDHLGVKNGEVYNGADDNASGASAMVELARNLIARRSELRRSVVICNFDAEEMGLHGSAALARRLNQELSTIALHKGNIFERIAKEGMQVNPMEFCQLMMSVDMVGWYKQSGHLQLQGTGTILHGGDLVGQIAEQTGIHLKTKRFETSVLTATDTEPFAKLGIPTLDVTTGIKSPYHKPADDAELIDFDGLNLVVDFLTELTLKVSQDECYKSSGRLAPKHEGKLPLFEMGVSLDGARTWADYDEGELLTHSGWGGGAGADLLLNLNPKGKNTFLSVRSGLYYDRYKTPFIDVTDPLHSSQKLKQSAIDIPLMLQANFRVSSMYINLGIGAYHHQLISTNLPSLSVGQLGSYDERLQSIGLCYNLGFRAGNWEFGVLGKSLRAFDDITLHHTRCYLTWYLW